MTAKEFMYSNKGLNLLSDNPIWTEKDVLKLMEAFKDFELNRLEEISDFHSQQIDTLSKIIDELNK